MSKDRQHIEHDRTRNSISYEHNKIIFQCNVIFSQSYLNLWIV